jgi:hypothetical protein
MENRFFLYAKKTFWYLEMRKINFNLVLPFISKRYICPIPSSMKMKNHNYAPLVALVAITLASCGSSKNKGGSLPNDGQLHGIAPGNRYVLPKPPGMVYIPQGTFHMGPSDEDPALRLVHVTVLFLSAASGWMLRKLPTTSIASLYGG